jgi:hypothetical protein
MLFYALIAGFIAIITLLTKVATSVTTAGNAGTFSTGHRISTHQIVLIVDILFAALVISAVNSCPIG